MSSLQAGLSPSLRRIVSARVPQPAAAERCELCSEEIPRAHGHLVSLDPRRLLCVCRACYLLFLTPGAAGGRYRSVPDRYEALTGGGLDRAVWDALQIPVGIACIFFNSALARPVALYPSPGGATESALPLDAWSELVAMEPKLASLREDVEALLVRRGDGPDGLDCCIVPIDACYELVGRLRRSWSGFGGGDEAWQEIAAFFAGVRERCGTTSSGGPA